MITNLVVYFYPAPHRRHQNVDAEIWSPVARPDWFTNVCVDKEEEVTLHQLQQSPELVGPNSLFFFFPSLRSHKQIKDVGGFSGVNPLMLKSVQGVYGKIV